MFGLLCLLTEWSFIFWSLRCVVKMKKKSNDKADLATLNSFGVRGGYILQRDLEVGAIVTV